MTEEDRDAKKIQKWPHNVMPEKSDLFFILGKQRK
jgi:hypothetical protein